MTAVVTGAAGHIGGNLVRGLIAHGQAVRALVRQDTRAIDGMEVDLVHGDIRDPTSLRRAFAGAEIVYHTAANISLAWGGWPQLEADNILGVRNVVAACLACRVGRVVHFSSIHALEQAPLDVPVDESRPLVTSQRSPPYDRSKAAGDRELMVGFEQGLDTIVIYPTGVIGPYDFKPSHFGAALLALARGRLPALIDGGFDWVDTRDVVEGALRAAASAPPGSRYLLSGHWIHFRDLASQVARLTGVPAPRFFCPIPLARLGAPFSAQFAHLLNRRPLYTSVTLRALEGNRQVSHERATRELGYLPRPFAETLADTLRWFSDAGRLPPLPPARAAQRSGVK